MIARVCSWAIPVWVLPGRQLQRFSDAVAHLILTVRWQWLMERNPRDKTNKMICLPSEDSDQPGHQSLRSAMKTVAEEPMFLHVDSKDSDQTGRMPRLIWVFAGRTCHFVGFVMRRLISYLPSLIRVFIVRMKIACAQADLTLHWAHMPYFCHAAANFFLLHSVCFACSVTDTCS